MSDARFVLSQRNASSHEMNWVTWFWKTSAAWCHARHWVAKWRVTSWVVVTHLQHAPWWCVNVWTWWTHAEYPIKISWTTPTCRFLSCTWYFVSEFNCGDNRSLPKSVKPLGHLSSSTLPLSRRSVSLRTVCANHRFCCRKVVHLSPSKGCRCMPSTPKLFIFTDQ